MIEDFLSRWQHTIATAFQVLAILFLFRIRRWTLVRIIYGSVLVSILVRRVLASAGGPEWNVLQDALLIFNSIGFVFVSWEAGQISRREIK